MVAIPLSYWPRPIGLPSFVGQSMSGSGSKIGFVLQAPKSGTIDRVLWHTGTVTTGDTVDVRLESVDAATGQPSGTLLATSTNVSVAVASGDDDTVFESTLDADVAVTLGDLIAVVIANGSTGSMEIESTSVLDFGGFPRVWRDGAGTGYASQQRSPVIGFRYNDGSYANSPGSLFIDTSGTGSTSSLEQGFRFVAPIAIRVCGFWVYGDFDNDMTVTLKADATSPGGATLLSSTVDKDYIRTTNPELMTYLFGATYDLSKDTAYKMTFLPTSGTFRFGELNFSSASHRDAAIWGAIFSHVIDDGASGWTETTTKQVLGGLVYDAIDVPSGSTVNPVFSSFSQPEISRGSIPY